MNSVYKWAEEQEQQTRKEFFSAVEKHGSDSLHALLAEGRYQQACATMQFLQLQGETKYIEL